MQLVQWSGDFGIVSVRHGWYHFPTNLCHIFISENHFSGSCWRLVCQFF